MEKYIIIATLSVGVIFFAVLTVLLGLLREDRVEFMQRALRGKVLGAVLSAVALAWCVPQVQAVAWSFLANWAWIIAAAAWVLAMRYLDNMAARGFSGLLIMGAYSFLDMSFDHQLNMGISGALPAWVWGAVGIVIAAKPCYLRDFLQLASQKSFWRYLTVVLTGMTALFLLAALIVFLKVQG